MRLVANLDDGVRTSGETLARLAPIAITDTAQVQTVVFGGEALEPERLGDVVGQHPGLPRLDQHVWHYRDDGACLVAGDRRR